MFTVHALLDLSSAALEVYGGIKRGCLGQRLAVVLTVHSRVGIELLGGAVPVSLFRLSFLRSTRSESPAPLADPNTTASLPPIPPSRSTPRPLQPQRIPEQLSERLVLPLEPAAGVATLYSGDARRLFAANCKLKPERAAYAPPAPPPRPNLAQVRAATGPGAGGEIYKVQAGDTPRSIAQKAGVSERALTERNNLDPTRLRIGQTLYLPKGGRAPIAPRAVAANQSKPAPAPDVHVVKTTAIQPPGQGGKPQPAAKAQAAPTPAVASSDEVIGAQNPQVASTQQSFLRLSQCPQQLPLAGAGAHDLRVRQQKLTQNTVFHTFLQEFTGFHTRIRTNTHNTHNTQEYTQLTHMDTETPHIDTPPNTHMYTPPQDCTPQN